MLNIHFSGNSISTENCMKGLFLVIFHIWKLYVIAVFNKLKKMIFFTFYFAKCLVVFKTEHK